MDNNQLKEEFEKDFWSKKDDDITPLEFSSKWWLDKMALQRKELVESIIKDVTNHYNGKGNYLSPEFEMQLKSKYLK